MTFLRDLSTRIPCLCGAERILWCRKKPPFFMPNDFVLRQNQFKKFNGISLSWEKYRY